MKQEEWIGLTDGVHRAKGLLTYWALYTLAMRQQLDSRREGKRWLVRTASLDRYVGDLRAKEAGQ